MEISVAQASNVCIQSVYSKFVMSPSDTVALGSILLYVSAFSGIRRAAL